MLPREETSARRLRWAAFAAAVLVFGTGTAAAHAAWQDRRALASGTTSTGSLSVSSTWTGSWSAWQPLFPGTHSDTATLRVTATGAGDTLRWKVGATPSVSAALAPYVSTQVYVGACGSGTPLPSSGYAPAGGYALGQSVDLCLRVTLSPSAPTTAQGATLAPQIAVSADQVTS